jgi:hypothetical protein
MQDAREVARRHLKKDPRQLFNINNGDMADMDQRIAKKLEANQEMRDQSLRLAKTRFVGKP